MWAGEDGAGGRGAVCLVLVGLWAGEDGAGGRGAVCLVLVSLWAGEDGAGGRGAVCLVLVPVAGVLWLCSCCSQKSKKAWGTTPPSRRKQIRILIIISLNISVPYAVRNKFISYDLYSYFLSYYAVTKKERSSIHNL